MVYLCVVGMVLQHANLSEWHCGFSVETPQWKMIHTSSVEAILYWRLLVEDQCKHLVSPEGSVPLQGSLGMPCHSIEVVEFFLLLKTGARLKWIFACRALYGFFRFPGIYPEPEYANALPVSQQARRDLFRKMQQDDGKVCAFGDFVEEANRREADSMGVLMGEEEKMMEQQKEKREEDDEWARICLSKLHSKNIALQEADEARAQAEEAKRSLEEMRRREEQLIAERDAMSELARKREEEAARAIEEAERREAAAAAAAASKVPSRSPTLTVEAAAGGMPRRGATGLSRSRTVSLSRGPHAPSEPHDGTPSRALSKDMPASDATPRLNKTAQDSFEIAAPKRLHTAIPQQGRRKGEVLNNGENKL